MASSSPAKIMTSISRVFLITVQSFLSLIKTQFVLNFCGLGHVTSSILCSFLYYLHSFHMFYLRKTPSCLCLHSFASPSGENSDLKILN